MVEQIDKMAKVLSVVMSKFVKSRGDSPESVMMANAATILSVPHSAILELGFAGVMVLHVKEILARVEMSVDAEPLTRGEVFALAMKLIGLRKQLDDRLAAGKLLSIIDLLPEPNLPTASGEKTSYRLLAGVLYILDCEIAAELKPEARAKCASQVLGAPSCNGEEWNEQWKADCEAHILDVQAKVKVEKRAMLQEMVYRKLLGKEWEDGKEAPPWSRPEATC